MARYTSSRLSHKAHPDPVSSVRNFVEFFVSVTVLNCVINNLVNVLAILYAGSRVFEADRRAGGNLKLAG